MASAITGINANSTQAPASSQSTAATTGTSPSDLQSMFLQLFVAQLQNQDPLNPPEGTEFVSQLAQLTEVEQVTEINSSVGSIDHYLTSASAAGSTSASSTAAGSTTAAAAGSNASAANTASTGQAAALAALDNSSNATTNPASSSQSN